MRAVSDLKAKASYLLLAAAVLFLDQFTKGLVEANYAPYSSHPVIPGFLSFTHVRNSGVAFGLFANQGDGRMGVAVLSLLGLVALGVVAVYFFRTPVTDRVLLVALALIAGGAVGNLVDRIGSGAVTDFIDAYVGSYHWHTFNIADSAITIGIVLMALDIFRSSTPPPAELDEA